MKLLSFLFPELVCCWVCAVKIYVPSSTEAWRKICTSCFDRFEEIAGFICQKCGRLLKAADWAICLDCQKIDNSFLIYNRSCVCYSVWVKNIICFYKHKGAENLASPLGSWLADLAIRSFSKQKIDLISWVPLHPERLSERGFNQAKLLALAVGANCRIPATNLLFRKKETKPQASLKKAERLTALEGVFGLDAKVYKATLCDKSILLVDDVYTTGATLRACAEVLNLAGAKVFSVTFAR